MGGSEDLPLESMSFAPASSAVGVGVGRPGSACPPAPPSFNGCSAVAECLHSALKITAVWILNVLVLRPATDGETARRLRGVVDLGDPGRPRRRKAWSRSS